MKVASTALAAVALTLALAIPAAASFPGASGLIAFTSNRDGHDEIYVMAPDGTNQTRLTNSAFSSQPSWSPDGSRIAYVTTGGIHVMNADGTGDQSVVSGLQPAWSHDGAKLIYVCGADICTVNVNGTGSTPLDKAPATNPTWSPKGNRIAYAKDNRIETADPDGTDVVNYSAPAEHESDNQPDFAPDGNSIVFTRNFDDGEVFTSDDIYRVTGAGGAAAQLTTDPANDRDPVTSPDGVRVAWWRVVDGKPQILVAGTQLTNLGSNSDPSWQPLPDRDGDALLDSWEADGLDSDGNGSIDLDLPGMGADPDHKDVFVEVDCFTGDCFMDSTLDRVAAAFAAAPVGNPDDTTGIRLHVDSGASSVMIHETDTVWGSFSESETFGGPLTLGTYANGIYDWTEFQALKDTRFETARHRVFHYAIAGHGVSGDQFVGISRGIQGSDMYFTSGGSQLEGSNDDFAANTFMHELGHNLGLGHGGADSENDKPNYLSVMNYSHPRLLMKADGTGILDFSRFVIPFDERALDELTGFGLTGPLAQFLAISRCPDGSKQVLPLAARRTDWNCDKVASPGPVSVDTNAFNGITELASQTDWDKLVYDGGLVGAKRFEGPLTTGIVEPSPAELAENAALYDAYLANPPGEPPLEPTPAPPGGATPSPTPRSPAATPRISALRLTPSRLRTRRAATIRFTLNVAAATTFRIERRVRGRRSGGRCKVGARTGARCTTFRRLRGSFRTAGRAGANTVRFSGLLAGRALNPGTYRLVATPKGGGAARVGFTVRRS